MFTINSDYFKSKPAELPKTTILLDNGYHPQKVEDELKKIYPENLTKIKVELSPKPSKAEKKKQGLTGFVPVKTRWVIERSNFWMERLLCLVKNFERTLENATAKINLRSSDIFLDLSDYQAFGRTGLEAMACGCIPVLPDRGGTDEYAIHNFNSLVIDTTSEEECIESISKLIQTGHNELYRLKLNAIETAARYSIKRAAFSICQIF